MDKSPFRALLLHPRVRSFAARIVALRFLSVVLSVEHPGTYIWGWLSRGNEERTLRLRGGRRVTVVPRRDTEALYEIFRARDYCPPVEVGRALGNPALILDVGANVGLFSAFASTAWPGAAIEAFEPDPVNADAYRRQGTPNCVLHEAAVGTADGEVRFANDMGSGSHVATASDSRVLTVPAIDLFPYLQRADLAKIDIEGAEWPILADRGLAELSSLVVVFEYHRVGAPSLPARDAADRMLRAAGFPRVTDRATTGAMASCGPGSDGEHNPGSACSRRRVTSARVLSASSGSVCDGARRRRTPPPGENTIRQGPEPQCLAVCV